MKFKFLLSLILVISASLMASTLKNKKENLNQIDKNSFQIEIAAPKQSNFKIVKSLVQQTQTKSQLECIQAAKPEVPAAAPPKKPEEVYASRPNQEVPTKIPIIAQAQIKPKSRRIQLECTMRPANQDKPVQTLPKSQPEKPKESEVNSNPKLIPICPTHLPEKPKESEVNSIPKLIPICPTPQPEKPKESEVKAFPECPADTKPSKTTPPIIGPPKIIDCEDWFPKSCCWWGITLLPKSFWLKEDLKEGKDFIVIGNNNNYLSCDQNGNLSIAKSAGKSELWRVMKKGERMINLLSYYGGYLIINEDGTVDAKSRVACDDAQIHVLHSFNQCEKDEVNYAAFRAINGLYLSLSNNKVSGIKEIKDQTEIFKGYLFDASASKCLQPLPAPSSPTPEASPAPEPKSEIIPLPSTNAPLLIPEEPISPINVNSGDMNIFAVTSATKPNTINIGGKRYALECKVNNLTKSENNQLGQGINKDILKNLKLFHRD